MLHNLLVTLCSLIILITNCNSHAENADWLDAMKDGFWAKDTSSDPGDEAIATMQSIIDSSHLSGSDLSGGGGVGMLSQMLSGLQSLDDTNGVMRAIKLYGKSNYDQLMFWAWVHRLAKELYENAMHVILMHEHMNGQLSQASSASQNADRMLLLRLFHYMLEHYPGSSWSKFVKTLSAFKPYLANLAKQMKKGELRAPSDSTQTIMQQFGTNGVMTPGELNKFAKVIDQSPTFNW